MQTKLLKAGMLLIAAVMLIGIAFAGAASAYEITVDNYNDLWYAFLDEECTNVTLGASFEMGTDPSPDIHINHDITLDLNGYSLTAVDGNRMFEVLGGHTFTLMDSSPEQTGKLIGSVNVGIQGGVVYIHDSSTFIMYGGNITGAGGNIMLNGGGVCVGISVGEDSSTFIMYGGTISNCVASKGGCGGGVYVNSGSTFTMYNGSITNCESQGTSQGGGGGVYLLASGGSKSATFTMYGGSITGCKATGTSFGVGGGVFVGGNARFTMTGGSITGCDADAFGGGVVCPEINVSGTARIIDNTVAGGNPMNVYLGNKLNLLSSPFTGLIGIVCENGDDFGTADSDAVGVQNFVKDDSSNPLQVGKHKEGEPTTLTWTDGYYVPFYIDGKLWQNLPAEKEGPVTDPSSSLKKEGYVLNGWYEKEDCTGTKWDFTEATHQDMKLYAKWTLIPYSEVSTWSQLNKSVAEWNATGAEAGLTRTVVVKNDILDRNSGENVDGINVYGDIILTTQASPTGSYTIDGNEYGRLFNVTGSGNLKVVGNGTSTTLNLTGGTSTDNGGGILVNDGGKLTLSKGSIITKCSATNGGGVYLAASTHMFMDNDATISGCTAQQGAGIYVTYSDPRAENPFKVTFRDNGTVLGNFNTSDISNNVYLNTDSGKTKLLDFTNPYTGNVGLVTDIPASLGAIVANSSAKDYINKYVNVISDYQAGYCGYVFEEKGALLIKWKDITYNISFDPNGGEGEMDEMKFDNYTHSQSLTPNVFTRDGYTFSGWNTKNDGSGVSYTDEEVVSGVTPFNNDLVTLYALWKKNSQPYTPSHKESGSTVILKEGQVVPTVTPSATPIPTVKPIETPAGNTTIKPTANPSTQPTQKSPAPFVGIIAGLGAALVLTRLRK